MTTKWSFDNEGRLRSIEHTGEYQPAMTIFAEPIGYGLNDFDKHVLDLLKKNPFLIDPTPASPLKPAGDHLITLDSNPVEWLARNCRVIDAQVHDYNPSDPMPINRDLFIFANGRRYERLLIEKAMRDAPPIELPTVWHDE